MLSCVCQLFIKEFHDDDDDDDEYTRVPGHPTSRWLGAESGLSVRSNLIFRTTSDKIRSPSCDIVHSQLRIRHTAEKLQGGLKNWHRFGTP